MNLEDGAMRIFVTGATGFIGGAIARRLAEDNEVVALSRSESGDEKIRGLGAKPSRGDLSSLAAGDIPACDAV
jgi:nucleoside-diphosphate-sugar epimerase